MSIEVLKRGIIPEKEQEFVKDCPKCKSKLKFMSADARRDYHAGYGQRDPDYYTYSINCPVCAAVVSANSDK